MSIRSYVDSAVKIDTPIVWVTTEKFKRRDTNQDSYLILEYTKPIKDSLFPEKKQRVVQSYEFSGARDVEQKVVKNPKKIGKKIMDGCFPFYIFGRRILRTYDRLKIELSIKQKKILKMELKDYTIVPVNLNKHSFLDETDIKDRFHSAAAAIDFLIQKVHVHPLQFPLENSLQSSWDFLRENITPTNAEDTSWDELVDHVVLVHAINQDSTYLHGLEIGKKLGISDEDAFEHPHLRVICSIFGAITPEGVLGSHLDFERQQLQGELIDRAHLHWNWNMVAEPNSGGNWEGSQIAILEPLKTFESENEGQLFGYAPYDTLTIGKHRLSKKSILVVPKSAYEKVRQYLIGFKGRIVTYNEEETSIRKVVTRILKKYYPNTWHMCDPEGNLISDEPKASTTGFRDITCMKMANGRVLKLIQGENTALAKAMQMPPRPRRFLGLHIHSQTILLEDSSNEYFKTMKRFKTNREIVKNSPLFAGQIKDVEQLKQMGSLYCLTTYNSLIEYSSETGSHQLAQYLMNEAIYADIISMLYENACGEKWPLLNFSRFDFNMLIKHVHPIVISHLKQIKEHLDGSDEVQAWDVFILYHKLIREALSNLRDSKLKVKTLIFREGEDEEVWLKRACLFMGYFEDEFDKVPIITLPTILCVGRREWGRITNEKKIHMKFELGSVWPLDEKFQTYVQKVLQVLPNDLELLTRLHFLLHLFEDPKTRSLSSKLDDSSFDPGIQLRCTVLKALIEWVMQEKLYLEPHQEPAPFFKLLGENNALLEALVDEVREELMELFPRAKLNYFWDNESIGRAFKLRVEARFPYKVNKTSIIFSDQLCEIRKFHFYFTLRRKRVQKFLKKEKKEIERFLTFQDKEMLTERFLLITSPTSDSIQPDLQEIRQNVLQDAPHDLWDAAEHCVSRFFGDGTVELLYYLERFQILRHQFPSFALFDALSDGDALQVSNLFRKYHSFFKSQDFQRAVPVIAFQNQYKFLHYLAKMNVPVNFRIGIRPLVFKMLDHDLHESFEALITARDYQINMRDAQENTVLHTIAKKGDETACNQLMANCSQFLSILNAQNKFEETAIGIALTNGYYSLIVLHTLAKQGDWSAYAKLVTLANRHLSVFRLFMMYKEIDWTIGDHHHVLCRRKELPRTAKSLLERELIQQQDLLKLIDKHDLNYVRKNGRLLSLMKLLFLESALKDYPDLFFANGNVQSEKLYLGAVEALVKNSDLDVNCQDTEGNTALHYAASTNYLLIVNSLLKWQHGKTDPNLQNKAGETPLHLAKDSSVIRKLVNQGAIPFMQDNTGKTPRERAETTGKEDLVQCLKECEEYFLLAIG